MTTLQLIQQHQAHLRQCNACPNMTGPVVTGTPVHSPVMLIGQAPGPREGALGRPFAWTAGKTLFKWFDGIGLEEEAFRSQVYMTAVCRCFPGKNPKGGDRVPDSGEIERCSQWLQAELELLQPELLLPVGKLAIGQFLKADKLINVIGRKHHLKVNARDYDLIPLPHPSGVSTWHRTEPGKGLLKEALGLIATHTAWRGLLDEGVNRTPV